MMAPATNGQPAMLERQRAGQMMISFACPSCQRKISVKDELAGKKGKCPGCGCALVVPLSVSATTGSPVQPRPANLDARTLPPRAPPGADPPTVLPRNRSQAGKDSLSDTPGKTDLDAGRHPEATQTPLAHGLTPELLGLLAPPQQPDEMGRLGPYRVLEVLGAGGMGVVFRAEDPGLQRLVALKAMLPSLACTPSAKERFFREARAAAALKDPHIVTIFAVGEDRGAPFLAMEFLEGEPLEQRLQRRGKLPVPEILCIGREICQGLAAAHDKGLIHRDIKPANIWLEGSEGHVKLLDFGVARAMAEQTHLTQPGAIIGTPAYMAPEQASGQKMDPRCDLFSLGCVLYRMCTGEMPFKGNDTIAVLYALAMETPRAPRALRADLPPALSELVMQLLAKKPQERPESARTVADALQQIEANPNARPAGPARKEQIESRTVPEVRVVQPGRPAQRGRPRRRKPTVWPWLVGGGVLGLALAVAAVVLLWPTPRGTVRIESNDDDVEIIFDRNSSTIRGAGKEAITLRAGQHGIRIQRGDFTFETDKLVVMKGQTITLKIEVLPGQIQVMQDGQVIASRDLRPTGVAATVPTVPKVPATRPPSAGRDPWLEQVATMPAALQVQAVAKRLKELNPGFDGKVKPTYVIGGAVTGLELSTDNITDISPVRALQNLQTLNCSGTANWVGDHLVARGNFADLAPLASLKLTTLICGGTKVSDLGPLRGMPLTTLKCPGTPLSDLSPLRDMKLTALDVFSTSVADLSPLKDMPLTILICGRTQVSDLSPLRGMQLTELDCDWTKVSTLAPLANMRLRKLNASVLPLADLTPLAGMPLTHLNLGWTRVVNLSPLRGLPLQELYVNHSPVVDLSPLRGMRLTLMNCAFTSVSDLSPLAGSPLAVLDCKGTRVSDLSPLRLLPLKNLDCPFRAPRDSRILRSIRTLERINGKPAAEFWREVDAGMKKP
jgi:serine/threonine protein kinase